MRKLASLLILIAFIACEKTAVKQKYNGLTGCEREQRGGEEIVKFNKQLAKLYAQSKTDPNAMLTTIDSLLVANKNEKDEYKSMIKDNIERELKYFKAELLYKAGQYESSLAILNESDYGCHTALAKAANYTKLKKHDLARAWVDSVNCYIADYALGNYYETVGDKDNAIKIYKDIESHKERGHYTYYPLAVEWLRELQKSNPLFLSELYYPTDDPSFHITDPQEGINRQRIFDTINSIPECKNANRIHIYKSPLENGSDYYWVKVSDDARVLDHHNFDKEYVAKYNFFVSPKDFRVMNYNPKTKALLTLEEWRKTIKSKQH